MTSMLPSKSYESKALMNLAAPLILAYLADVLMVVTTKIVVGKLGYLELAAAGVSTDLAFQFAIVTKGFLSVIGVFVSGAYGASRKDEALPALYRGLVLALVLGILLTVVVFNLDVILRAAGQDPAVIAMARPFYENFAWAMLPTAIFGVLRVFVSALMRTGFILLVSAATLLLNYVLMQGLVHGQFGLPQWGLAGAGIAWSASVWFMCLCLGIFSLWLIRKEGLRLSDRRWFTSFSGYLPILHLGLPVAGIVALESGLFAAASLLSGILGAKDLAAYQILMGWITIPFVISLGFSEAAMVRVAFWSGAGNRPAARLSGNLSMLIGVAIPLALVAVPLALPDLVINAFLDPADEGYSEIAALVGRLLLIGAVFQVFDGLQAIASHALRGLRDGSMPLVIAAIGYWPIGFGAAYYMAFVAGWGAVGLWWGIAAGLAFTGVVLAWRFENLARQEN